MIKFGRVAPGEAQMSIGSVGGSTSFWQQDQSYWQQGAQNSNTIAATDSIINAMSSAETSEGKGLASIANQTALNRTNSQLTAAIENVLNGDTGSSSSSTSVSSSSSSSGSSPSPASGTGAAALSVNTPLSLLGVLAGGKITVSAGANTTTYTSTGNDTVGDLLNALSANDYGNAQVNASLNSSGNLVITGKNDKDTITVGGVYASNIGFAVGHQTFSPTKSSRSSAASTSTSSTSPTLSSTKSSSSSNAKTSYTTVSSEMSSSAASLLSDSGVGGTLVDMLA
jgi:trimeric autotransporter adhesin